MGRALPLGSSDATRAALGAENQMLRATLDAMRQRIGELERLADSDTLTPLANRRFFLRALARTIAQVARHGIPSVAMFVDLDGLKAINDAHGHAAGDAALVHIARILRTNVRITDTVARIGGDEFGLLLDHLNGEAAQAKAAALSALVASHPLSYEGRTIALSVSIGATMVMGDDSTDAALSRADSAMYGSKRA